MPKLTLCSHIIPFFTHSSFPKHWDLSVLTEVVCSPNSFAAGLRCVARKQSCPNGVALGPACPGAEAAENPISHLDGGSKHFLACSTSLNHPNPAREEADMEGDAPSSLKGSVQIGQSLFFLIVAYSYPEQQGGSAEPPPHVTQPVWVGFLFHPLLRAIV